MRSPMAPLEGGRLDLSQARSCPKLKVAAALRLSFDGLARRLDEGLPSRRGQVSSRIPKDPNHWAEGATRCGQRCPARRPG